ncbi:FAD-dependent monooxygenase [Nocardia sp. NPDC051570]|uniref:FAD-dependent monooxygenase n=1 Tax=Nocardia sp. NPDC051570 TaxID=3364324 RepID=UPI0037BD57C6
MSSIRVAIVGGGIGGLAAALALRSAGAQVGLYEQAARLGEVGAGVGLAPNSMRVLRRLGVDQEVARRAVPVEGISYRHSDGSPAGYENFGVDGSILGIYRPDLIEALAGALPGAVLHTGHRCTAFRQGDRSAEVTFDNGSSVEADIVIAADGIHSALQHYVVEPQPPVFSGMIAYRGALPASRVPDWPRSAMVMWTGQGKHFLTFGMRAGELRNYVGFVPADEQMRESWSAPGDPATLAAEFSGWDPQLTELLAQVETTFRWGLYDRNPLPRWTHGRLALLGDAAHPMLPHMGQGANQAIEDGMALATLIRGIPATEAPAALTRYEHLRRPRTAEIQQGSRANGLRLDSGRTVTLYEPAVHDYDIEAAALASR